MLITKPGLYRANAKEIGVAYTGPNQLLTCTCRFSVFERMLDSGEWEEASGEITGYFYLTKRDGTLNTAIYKAIMSAFLWDGRDPTWLQDAELDSHPVQIRVIEEEYKGATKCKVAMVRAADAPPEGGIQKTDGETKRKIAAKFAALVAQHKIDTSTPF